MSDTFHREVEVEIKPVKSTQMINEIKTVAEELEKLLVKVNSRGMSIALTHLETCVLWAAKAINQVEIDKKRVR